MLLTSELSRDVIAARVFAGTTNAPQALAVILQPPHQIRPIQGKAAPVLQHPQALPGEHMGRHAAAGALFSLFPWVLLGFAGGAVMLRYPDGLIRPVVGTISLVMLLLFVWRQRKTATIPKADWKHAGFYGTSAGFATMVANAAGPIMNMYLLSKKLPREEFVATGAWFFFIINLSKVPVYYKLGLFSQPSLSFDVVIAPFVIAGALTGRKLLVIMPEKIFVNSVVALAFLATLLLFLPK